MRRSLNNRKPKGVVEVASDTPQGGEFYLPHKPVVREGAESSNLRIVYDASALADPQASILNECLYDCVSAYTVPSSPFYRRPETSLFTSAY